MLVLTRHAGVLVLTRHAGEAIRIGDDVTIVVRKIIAPDDSANVHIAIEAPPTVEINRVESPRRKQRPASNYNR